MEIDALLTRLASQHGSDLFLSTGAPPSARFQGVLTALSEQSFKPGEVAAIASSLMDAEQRQEFDRDLEMNLAISRAGIGRFRVNIFKQRNDVSIVIRNVKLDIPRFEDLKLPPVLLDSVMLKQGLILFVGATDSGKSTSLAALIDHRNRHSSGHIVTIEDPIEYIHRHRRSIINQREVGPHTLSFNNALRSALREDPDAILVGELRDLETIRLALSAAETGHLVFGTLHTSSAAKTIDRIVDVFPADEKEMVRAMLSESLRAVISQALLKKVGGGRTAAWEIMVGTPAIRNLIREDKVAQMYSAIQTGQQYGMMTLDQHLQDLVKRSLITRNQARDYAKDKRLFE